MGETRTGACAVPNGASAVRRVHFHDGEAPVAAVVAPSVFVAARDGRDRLLVRRWDSGAWELPGGRVEVGESVLDAAVRETVEESGVLVRITGVVGLFTDPAHVVVSATGREVRQQFVVCLPASGARQSCPGRTGDDRCRLVRSHGCRGAPGGARGEPVDHIGTVGRARTPSRLKRALDQRTPLPRRPCS
jgi:ADP-ribose pyrophosphatase YjhB (NUDIX family)